MKKGWLVLLCILVLLTASGIWWSLSQPPKSPGPFLLPDSNRVHLVAVTVGTNTKVHFGTPVERVLARLPGKWGQRFRQNEVTAFPHRSTGAQVLLWFRFDRPPPPGTYFRARFLENGEPLLTPWFSSSPRTLSNGQAIAYCGTHLWPRRGRTLPFRLELAQRSPHESHDLGDIIVPNPAYQAYPVWTAENLPSTRSFQGADFTLVRPIPQGHLQVYVTANGKPDPAWEVRGYWLRDATGNFVPDGEQHSQTVSRRVADRMGVVTLSPLPVCYGMPKDSAYKLGMRFVRTSDFTSNEVFLLRGVPATPVGPAFSRSWTFTTNLPIGMVQLKCQPDWENGSRNLCIVPSQTEPANFIKNDPNSLEIVMLGAVNDLGITVQHVDTRKIHVPPGSKTLDITVAVPRQHIVEFAVDPRIVTGPVSTPEYLKFPESLRPENILRELNNN